MPVFILKYSLALPDLHVDLHVSKLRTFTLGESTTWLIFLSVFYQCSLFHMKVAFWALYLTLKPVVIQWLWRLLVAKQLQGKQPLITNQFFVSVSKRLWIQVCEVNDKKTTQHSKDALRQELFNTYINIDIKGSFFAWTVCENVVSNFIVWFDRQLKWRRKIMLHLLL